MKLKCHLYPSPLRFAHILKVHEITYTADFPRYSPYSTKRWVGTEVVFNPKEPGSVMETLATSGQGTSELGRAGSLEA